MAVEGRETAEAREGLAFFPSQTPTAARLSLGDERTPAAEEMARSTARRESEPEAGGSLRGVPCAAVARAGLGALEARGGTAGSTLGIEIGPGVLGGSGELRRTGAKRRSAATFGCC